MGGVFIPNFVFSIVMAIFNVEEYIEEAIGSLINQSFDFNKVQLILVDDGSTDNSREIALKYQSKYPNNILVLSKENGGQASARNYGLKYVEGEYVNFLDPDDKLSKNTLNAVYNFFNNNNDIDLVSIPLYFFERKEGSHILNSKFVDNNRIVNLSESVFDIQLSAPALFVKNKTLNNQSFDTNVIHGEDSILINKILIKKMKYGLIGLNQDAYYLYRKRFSNDSTLDLSTRDKKYFTHKLKHYFKYLFNYSIQEEGSIPDFIQALVAYDLQFLADESELPEDFTNDEIKEFWYYFKDVLSNIDDEIIIKHKFISKRNKNFLIYIKRNDFHIVSRPKKHKVFLKSGDYVINRLHLHKLYFDFVEFKEGSLNFSGYFNSSCDSEFIQIFAEVRGKNKNPKIFKANYVEYPKSRPSPKKILSINWKFIYNFDLKIPMDKNELHSIKFKILYQENGNEVKLRPDIKFRNYSNINELVNYFIKDERIVIFENNMFYISPYSYAKLAKSSFKSIMNLLNNKEFSFIIPSILIYLFLYPFMKNREIWLFEDRPSIADDNAMHLFSYAVKQEDNIKKYFVVDKKSQDFDKMLKIDKNIVPFKSFKHKILYLFSDKIISSHTDLVFLNPFYNNDVKGYRSIASFRKYFLQHGVIQGDLSHWLRKYYHNLSLFVTSSTLERNSIINGGYNYNEDIIQLLGLPRYDNLKADNLKKEILFIPTWRNYLTEDNVIYSDYYKKLNSFFNNDKLKSILEDKGYKLVFKPHYNLLPFLNFLNIDKEYIRIAENESYQDLFNKSSVMITDYSSVFFDFAYLKKPIIYYQETDDYHYGKSYWNYETMGFGEVIKSEDNLIDKIIEYIDNDCQMEEEYKNRVDNFFKFKDKNNCKRVYEWILEH